MHPALLCQYLPLPLCAIGVWKAAPSWVGRDDPGAPCYQSARKQLLDDAKPHPRDFVCGTPVDGAPGSSRPTNISGVIGCLKRFTNRDAGENLWQSSYYDHIIRNEADYLRIWTYIENNPAEWGEDPYFEA